MAGEGNASLVDHALVHGSGDNGIVASAAAASDRMFERRQHRTGIARVELAGLRSECEWHVFERPVRCLACGAEP